MNNNISNNQENLNDTIGYKKPPKHSQFKKGVSGNPAGRKKKVVPTSIFNALIIGLNESKTIRTETGAYQKLTYSELLAKKMLQDAIQKDGNTRKFLMEKFFKLDLISQYNYIVPKNQSEMEYDPEREEIRKACLKGLHEFVKQHFRNDYNQ